jgi:hypothetical protein
MGGRRREPLTTGAGPGGRRLQSAGRWPSAVQKRRQKRRTRTPTTIRDSGPLIRASPVRPPRSPADTPRGALQFGTQAPATRRSPWPVPLPMHSLSLLVRVTQRAFGDPVRRRPTPAVRTRAQPRPRAPRPCWLLAPATTKGVSLSSTWPHRQPRRQPSDATGGDENSAGNHGLSKPNPRYFANC